MRIFDITIHMDSGKDFFTTKAFESKEKLIDYLVKSISSNAWLVFDEEDIVYTNKIESFSVR